MQILAGVCLGLVAWFVLRILLMGVYTVDQNERAVKTRFGRAVRVPGGEGYAGRSRLGNAAARGAGAVLLSAGAGDPAGRTVFQDAVGKDLQSLDRHHDGEHGAGPGGSRSEERRGGKE